MTQETSTNPVTLIEHFFDRLKAGDIPGALADLHPDCIIDEPDGLPYGGQYHGHAGLGQLFASVTADYEFEIGRTDIRAAGVGVVGSVEATFISRASGRRLDTRVVEIYSFTDGLLSHVDVFPKDTQAIVDLGR